MPKRRISSKVVDARILALYELDQFIDYIRTVDPELKPNESPVVAAVVLNNLPNLFLNNPLLMDELKEVVAIVKNRQASRNAQSSMN
ncbi:hypothetical protein PQG02_06900 [Nostoc sp. UHCC 0926]|uniref:hypothetical protein n=1 Tax=unclassified Nostoc TaxID=2593658 RepID=UPI00235E7681|nr:hypothetical protein [Nostoc sp. UHCC 0926]WDD34069.1 hypothetical protein PQG02_06900 [Nostoc sp. UHCC 0926]